MDDKCLTDGSFSKVEPKNIMGQRAPKLHIPLPPVDPPIASLTYDTLFRAFEFIQERPMLSTGITRSKQLYYAALTCKAFVNAALDHLWRSMNSIFPLVRILPMLDLVDGVYMLTRRLGAEERTRLEVYTRRIRFLAINDSVHPVFSPLTTMELQSSLSSLQQIYCSSPSSLMMTIFPIILSKTLRRFELNAQTHVSHIHIQSFLYALQSKAPDLEQLVIRRTLVDEGTFDAVLGFSNLRLLDFSPAEDIPLVHIYQIFMLPEIRVLALDLPDRIAPYLRGKSREFPTLIKLTKLHALCFEGRASTVAFVLSRMRDGFVKEVDIKLRQDPPRQLPRSVKTGEDLPSMYPIECCVGVFRAQWQTALYSIILSSGEDRPSSLLCSCKVLSGLEQLPRLSKLHIVGWTLSLPQCAALSRGISHIEDLRIEVASLNAAVTGQDLSFFGEFARNCPNLALFHVKFDKCQQNTKLSSPELSRRSNAGMLKELVVETRDVLDMQDKLKIAVDVAQYLGLLFPGLQNIRPMSGISAGFWGHVFRMVRLVHDVKSKDSGSV
ncbi:hypothetical protein DXG01_007688 [Tephrocybe rancida]|nr:hypothetical protein DXG01_007688 [Tephrocybe rancida]